MRVLLAEEDANIRRLVQKTLDGLGHECVLVDTVTQMMSLLAELMPDAAILAHGLRDVTLPDLCRRIRAAEEGHRTHLIVLANDRALLEAAIEAGADDFMSKPFDAETVRARILVTTRIANLRHAIAEQRIEIDRMTGEMTDDGRRDPLTRIGNRRRMREDLESLSDRGLRYGHTFVIGLYNVDHFRLYNAKCGSSAGDEALRVVARSLANHGRAGDAAYRSAGADFVVVLPEQTLDRAMIGLERRRRTLERLAIPHPGEDTGGIVTISGGAAAFDPTAAHPADAVLERAREALYRAQQAGRNRIEAHRGAATGSAAVGS